MNIKDMPKGRHSREGGNPEHKELDSPIKPGNDIFILSDALIPNKQGIALLPIMLILLIVATLIGIGVSLIGPRTQREKSTETKDTIDAAVDSVISWATANKRLPQYTPVDEFTPAVRNPNDAFGKPLIYLYDAGLTDISTGGLCGRRTTNYPSGCGETNCAAFIIISGGNDYTVDSTPANSQSFPPSITLSSSDIYKVVTLAELKHRAGCYGQTGGRLTILNNELPNGRVGQAYNATVYADGGVPPYNWCIETSSGDLPNGISELPVAIPVVATGGCASAAFGSSTTVQLSASPVTSPPGTYSISFFVKDNNDSVIHKNLLLRIKTGGVGPPGSQISFAGNMPDFKETESSGTSATINPDNTVSLGGCLGADCSGPTGGASGCVWYQDGQSIWGRTVRTYFDFQFMNVDSDAKSEDFGSGFTFSIIQDSGNDPATTNLCGGKGADMGYAGSQPGTVAISGRSLAVEFDSYPDNEKNDPVNFNHIAIVRDYNGNASNKHDYGNNPICPGIGCYKDSTIAWLEQDFSPANDPVDGRIPADPHKARVEIQTKCNSACSSCNTDGAGYTYALISVWVDCENCNDLRSDFAPGTLKATHCFDVTDPFKTIKFGFTNGTQSTAITQLVKISNFGICFDDSPNDPNAGCSGQ